MNENDPIMRPDRPVGIVGYGAYVPRYRIAAESISQMWTMGAGGTPVKEKSVNSLDEDVATMSIEAARNAMNRAQIDPQELRAVWVGSESHPYAVKPTSTIVAEAIGAVPNTQAADWEFACKAGTEAMQAAIGLVGSGMGKYALAIGMDTAQGRPGDALEYTAAAGGAAILIGVRSLVDDSYAFRERLARAFRERGFDVLTAADYDWAVFHQPNVKFPSRAGQMLGFSAEQMKPGLLAGVIGNTYSGSSIIGLTGILDVAQPGDRILMVSYGSGAGSDAFDLSVTDKIDDIRNRAPGVQQYIARRKEIDYATYTRYRGKIKMS